jgi:hypothetical protein
MTLIATVWSPEGFAIAADGFEVLDGVGATTKDVQKIFGTSFVNDTGFAWAWVGNVGVDLTSGFSYNLKEITQRVMDELPEDAHLDDPESYFDRIASRIFYELPSDVILSGLADGDDEIIFVGYLAGKPLWREIVLQRRGSMFLQWVVIEPAVSLRDFYAFAGSATIDNQIRNAGSLQQPLDILEAANSVRTYAEMCVGNREKVNDCRNFGGTVHIATVTPAGFSWINPPVDVEKE